MKSMHIVIEPNYSKMRNEMHFEAQLRERAHIFTPKKGKGSYNRNRLKKIDY